MQANQWRGQMAEMEQVLGKEKRLQRWVAGHARICVSWFFKKYSFYSKCDEKPWKGFEIILVA